MLVERYLRKRYEAGKAEGLTKAWQVWEAWNQRRLAAEAADHPFNEPPPALNNPT